jgi:type IV secretory pathway TrbD component
VNTSPAIPAISPDAADRRVHAALVRPVLMAGVERPVLALEVTVALGLFLSVGPRLVTLGVVALVVGVVHPTMVWLTARDAMATAVYMRSLVWRAYYPPHADPRAGLRRASRARPTLPSVS